MPIGSRRARSRAPSRGRLKSLRVTPTFREFALDQLTGVPELYARAMFGGVGLYSGEVFFGILAADRLYLKVDDTNRRDYDEAGMRPFKPYADRAMTMPYYEVPVGVLEDATTLAAWARRSIAVAKAAKAGRREGVNVRARCRT